MVRSTSAAFLRFSTAINGFCCFRVPLFSMSVDSFLVRGTESHDGGRNKRGKMPTVFFSLPLLYHNRNLKWERERRERERENDAHYLCINQNLSFFHEKISFKFWCCSYFELTSDPSSFDAPLVFRTVAIFASSLAVRLNDDHEWKKTLYSAATDERPRAQSFFSLNCLGNRL